MNKLSTRERIVEVADKLFYQHGFEHTSFADIAKDVNISRGNFYHHFKTKDDILKAVIDIRLARTKAMLDHWESLSPSPVERIKCYIRIVITNWGKIMHYGCPVGTLASELSKLDHASHIDAKRVFMLFRDWLKTQFTLMGNKKNADDYAMHILSWSQGVAILGNTFQDKDFVEREVRTLCDWLDSCSEKPK